PVSLRTPGSVWANIISGNRNAVSNAKTHANLLAFISHPPRNGKAGHSFGPGMLLVTFLHSPLPFLMIEPEKRAGLTGPGLSGLGLWQPEKPGTGGSSSSQLDALISIARKEKGQLPEGTE